MRRNIFTYRQNQTLSDQGAESFSSIAVVESAVVDVLFEFVLLKAWLPKLFMTW